MTVAVNKCNITGYANDLLNQLYYGLGKADVNVFLDNYINFLACPDISERVSCYEDTCVNPTIVIICALQIAKISYTIDDRTITFYVAPTDLTGQKDPVNYQWHYIESDFDLSSPEDKATIALTLKGDKQFDALVSQIGVDISDNDDCKSTKTCYYTPTGIVCIDNYAECSNPMELKIVNKIVHCNPVSTLAVTRKT